MAPVVENFFPILKDCFCDGELWYKSKEREKSCTKNYVCQDVDYGIFTD